MNNSDVYNLQLSHFLIKDTEIENAETASDIKKIEDKYDIGYGDLLLLEVRDPGQHVLVGNGRIIFFSEKAGKILSKNKMRFIIENFILII